MLARLAQHALQVQPVGGLQLGAPADRDPRRQQPVDELVADQLELAEVKQPRLAVALVRAREPAGRIGGHERLGELPLEPRDLLLQGAAGRALIKILWGMGSASRAHTEPDDLRAARLSEAGWLADRRREAVDRRVVEQLRHSLLC